MIANRAEVGQTMLEGIQLVVIPMLVFLAVAVPTGQVRRVGRSVDRCHVAHNTFP